MSHVAKSAEFSLNPSRYALYARLGIVFIAGFLVAALPILLFAKISGLIFLLAAGYSFYQHFCQQAPEQLFALDIDANSWRLISPVKNQPGGGGEAVDLRLEPSQFVTAYLVILYFRSLQDGRLVRVIPRDSMSGDEHRILRKLLLSRANCD